MRFGFGFWILDFFWNSKKKLRPVHFPHSYSHTMGLDDPAACKKYIRMRLPDSFLTNEQWLKKHNEHSGKVSFLVLDFLLHIHQIAHSNKLSFDMVQSKLKKVFTDFISSFPRLNTMVVLLDEQEFTPLGKIPTQQSRSDSLTMEERSSIMEGGVLENVDASMNESIDETFKDHPDVVCGKKTAFAVFFSKYVRTRALRKDLTRMVTKTLIDLIEEKRIPYGLRIYIDGISYSTYYAPSSSFFHTEDGQDMSSTTSLSSTGSFSGTSGTQESGGTPLLKRRKSISAVGDVSAHTHMDKDYIRLCKLDVIQNEHNETVAKPVWLTKKDQDADIFGGFDGGMKRPYMGESDVKIPYYLWKIASMLDYRLKRDGEENGRTGEDTPYEVTVYISSWDSDCIPLSLMAMSGVFKMYPRLVPRKDKSPDTGVPRGGEHNSPRAVLRVLLDSRQGGSFRDMLKYREALAEGVEHPKYPKKKDQFIVFRRRFVSSHEDEYLTDIMDIGYLIYDIKSHFLVRYPLCKNPVETLCLFLMCGGTDYVRSLPGVGFSTMRSVFDAGGYLLLANAISIQCEKQDDGKLKMGISINETDVLGFYNLCVRFALPHGSMGGVSSTMTTKKKDLTKKINASKKALEELKKALHPTNSAGHTPQDMEEAIRTMEMKREFLESFLWASHYDFLTEVSTKIQEEDSEEGEEELANYLGEISGMTECEHDDWDEVDDALRSKKRENIKRTRKTLETKHKKAQNLVQKLSEDEKKWTQAQKKEVDKLIGKNTLSGKEAIAKLRTSVPDPRAMSDEEVYATRPACITDIKGLEEIKPLVRTLVWCLIYWRTAPFVCLRDTQTLRSTCLSGEDGEMSVFGYKSTYRRGNKRKKRTVAMADKVSPGKTISITLK